VGPRKRPYSFPPRRAFGRGFFLPAMPRLRARFLFACIACLPVFLSRFFSAKPVF
jgi:hypothetical protein